MDCLARAGVARPVPGGWPTVAHSLSLLPFSNSVPLRPAIGRNVALVSSRSRSHKTGEEPHRCVREYKRDSQFSIPFGDLAALRGSVPSSLSQPSSEHKPNDGSGSRVTIADQAANCDGDKSHSTWSNRYRGKGSEAATSLIRRIGGKLPNPSKLC